MIAAICSLALLACQTSGYELTQNVPYRDTGEARCKLDYYRPRGVKGFATVVWFHGGGLTGGDKEIPAALREKGLAVVGATYRLSPAVKVSDCISDAAAALAWAVKNVPQSGGDPAKIFVSGHSAGGYLASMVVLDKSWLKPHGVDPDKLAGLVPFSGQAITHFTRRKELGLSDTQPLVDELAPLYHVRKDCPPVLILSGDRGKEMLGRYEENAYFWRMFQVCDHPDAMLIELSGTDHNGMVAPGMKHLLEFVTRRSKEIDGAGQKAG